MIMTNRLAFVGLSLSVAVAAPLAAQEWHRVNIDRTPVVVGNGQIVTQQRAVGDFRAVSLRGAGDLTVEIGPRASLRVSADSNILPLLVQRERGDELILETKQSYRSRTKPRYVLTVPSLDSIGIGGSGDARVGGVSSDRFSIAIGGSGHIVARGRTGRLMAAIGGSGDIDARALQASSASVTIGGSGTAQVATNGPLSGSIAGSGSIRYLGRPSSISVSRVGSGTVTQIL
jgi:hypothetical protein